MKKNKVRIWTPQDLDKIMAEEQDPPNWFRKKINRFMELNYDGHSVRIDYSDFSNDITMLFRKFNHGYFIEWIKKWFYFGWSVHVMETRQIGVGTYVILSKPKSLEEKVFKHVSGYHPCLAYIENLQE